MTLSWNGLVCGYADQEPLHTPFSGVIKEPGIYAVIGPNGSGKSTLLKTWLGLVPPRQGTVLFNGQPVLKRHDISQGIGYVPQSHRVNKFFHITVSDFIRQGYGPRHKDTAQSKTRIGELLEQWQLTDSATRSFHELSGGQKTRAMVARAIVSSPQALFLDEPLASLDGCCQDLLMETLHRFTHEKGVWAIMIDHHFGPFEKYLAEKITFNRAHNQEICTISFQFREHACCAH